MNCLFCLSNGPFSTKEHIIPESLGNTDLLLEGFVCDACQNYFGKEIESFVLSKTPFGIWRTLMGIPTKSGNMPSIDMSMPVNNKGRIPYSSNYHDQGIRFTYHRDDSVSVDIHLEDTLKEIIDGKKTRFQFVISPLHISMIGRFLGKIGLELICLKYKDIAFSNTFNPIRDYSRKGSSDDLWPICLFR